MDSLGLAPDLHRELWVYLERAAHFMVNTADETVSPLPGLPLGPH